MCTYKFEYRPIAVPTNLQIKWDCGTITGAWYCKEIVFDGKGQNPVFTNCQDAVYRQILARSIINTHQTCIDG